MGPGTFFSLLSLLSYSIRVDYKSIIAPYGDLYFDIMIVVLGFDIILGIAYMLLYLYEAFLLRDPGNDSLSPDLPT